MNIRKKRVMGFSLLEMLAVIAVIAVLVAIFIPVLTSQTIKSAAAANAANLRGIEGEVTTMKLIEADKIKDGVFTYFAENDVLTDVGNLPAPGAKECGPVKEGTQMRVRVNEDGTTTATYRGYDVTFFAEIAETGKVPDGWEDTYMTSNDKFVNQVEDAISGIKDAYNKMEPGEKAPIDFGVALITGGKTTEEFIDWAEDQVIDTTGQVDEDLADLIFAVEDKVTGGGESDGDDDETPATTEGAGSGSGSGSPSCVTPDTMITLADGTKVRVDALNGDEELLVWNMETGMLDSAPIMFVDTEPEAVKEVINLHFSDGSVVKVISEHGFWDYTLNKYVYLDRNASLYAGHSFFKLSENGGEKVELVEVVLTEEVTTAWSPVTVGHLCYFVNDMLSMPGGVGGLFNIFEVDPETMTYDYEAMERDLTMYGVLTYEELSAVADLSEEMFNAAGGAYLKVSMGKGNLTEEELFAMIDRYGKFFE